MNLIAITYSQHSTNFDGTLRDLFEKKSIYKFENDLEQRVNDFNELQQKSPRFL
jgi:hypothetical protein